MGDWSECLCMSVCECLYACMCACVCMYYMRITCGPDCEIFFFGFTVGGRHDWVIDCRTSTRSSRVEDIFFLPGLFPAKYPFYTFSRSKLTRGEKVCQ